MWQYCQKIFAKRINSLYIADKVLKSIIAAEYKLEGYKMPKSWMEAFFLLEQLLQGQDKGERQVIFIDELPWMDTPRSGFLPAFENFRNGWCSGRDNIMLVVCVSATSWILSNLSRSKGGLYGRLTAEIKLSPFTTTFSFTFRSDTYFLHNTWFLTHYNIIKFQANIGCLSLSGACLWNHAPFLFIP